MRRGSCCRGAVRTGARPECLASHARRVPARPTRQDGPSAPSAGAQFHEEFSDPDGRQRPRWPGTEPLPTRGSAHYSSRSIATSSTRRAGVPFVATGGPSHGRAAHDDRVLLPRGHQTTGRTWTADKLPGQSTPVDLLVDRSWRAEGGGPGERHERPVEALWRHAPRAGVRRHLADLAAGPRPPVLRRRSPGPERARAPSCVTGSRPASWACIAAAATEVASATRSRSGSTCGPWPSPTPLPLTSLLDDDHASTRCRDSRARRHPPGPSGGPSGVGRRRDVGARPPLHLRRLRHRLVEPLRPRRGPGGGRDAGQVLQPAVHPRRRRARQDPPAPRHRELRPGELRRPPRPLRLDRDLPQRVRRRHPEQHHHRLQAPLPRVRRPAHRRRPVHGGQRGAPRGVLPHLQPPLRCRPSRWSSPRTGRPKSIATLEDRLRSRFLSGLITDVQPPELETRLAILQKKARARARPRVPHEVLEFIATNVTDNIRELEGALIRVTRLRQPQQPAPHP